MLVVVGDSHTIALRAGLEKLKVNRPGLLESVGGVVAGQLDHGYKFMEPFYNLSGNTIEFSSPRAYEFFGKIVEPGPAYISQKDRRRYAFCIGFHPSGSLLSRNWKDHNASQNEKGKLHISDAAFAEVVRNYTKDAIRFFIQLKCFDISFSVVACCPLPQSSLPTWEAEFYSGAEILEYHNRFRDTFAAELKRLDIKVHLPARSSYTQEGYMREELANKDGDYHANGVYGEMMLQQIIAGTPKVKTNTGHSSSSKKPKGLFGWKSLFQ